MSGVPQKGIKKPLCSQYRRPKPARTFLEMREDLRAENKFNCDIIFCVKEGSIKTYMDTKYNMYCRSISCCFLVKQGENG